MTHLAHVLRSSGSGFLSGTAAASILAFFGFCGGAGAQESSLVYPGESGRLLYATQPDGDRIIDHSWVGYQSGEVPIPDVATVITVAPRSGDDTRLLQAAINAVEAMPMGPDGFRGAIQLTAGEFQIEEQIDITKSGVVLRGAGNDINTGTVIRATGTSMRELIRARIEGPVNEVLTGPLVQVIDKRVPVGATSFRVEHPENFAVGDFVQITRPGTQAWIDVLGMDEFPEEPDGTIDDPWLPSEFDLKWERNIIRVEGDRVFFDAPLTNSLEDAYGGGTIQKFALPSRISNVGIESLYGISHYDLADPQDEDHSWTFILFRGVENGWVRDVTAQHFAFAATEIWIDSRNITVQDCQSLDPISIITGGRRYPFVVERASLVLFQRLFSDGGRHDFVQNNRCQGPIVFYDCLATNSNSDTGPHQNWSTGGLYDNVVVQGDSAADINFQNRSTFGNGHGWAGANNVAWNCIAQDFRIQSPPTAQNWAIGNVGNIIDEMRFGPQPMGIFDSHNTPVATTSLYRKQLEDRTSFPGDQFFEYVKGDYDDFTNDGAGSVDEASRSAGFDAAFGSYLSSRATMGYDDTTNDAWVPLSWQFGVDQGKRVYHAVLTVSMKRSGGLTTNDSLWYERLENRLGFASDLGLTTNISDTESTVVVQEFHGTDTLWFADGEFNVMIGEDVAIDWARLDLYMADAVEGDINADGTLNPCDVRDFVSLVESGDPRAERTGDNPASVDVFDLLSELAAYDALPSASSDGCSFTPAAIPTSDGFGDADWNNDAAIDPLNGESGITATDPSDTGFAWVRGAGAPAISVSIDDESGAGEIGAGLALHAVSSATNVSLVMASIEPVVLANAGDSVSFSLDVRMIGSIPLLDNHWRMGIYNDDGTPPTEGGGTAGTDFGYFARFDTGPKDPPSGAPNADPVTVGLGAESRSQTGDPSSESFRSLGSRADAQFALDDNDTHSVEIRITRQAEFNLMELFFDGGLVRGTLDTNAPPDEDLFTFNEIWFGTNASPGTTFAVDNVEVSFVPAGTP